jgi:Tol biopolymer transport system component
MVRDALEQMLGSQTFRQSTRVCGLLRFAVEASMRGETDTLKESVLGVQVFGRAPDYDPKSDPIVRVTAARLRAKIDEYYRSEGRFDQLRIEFPKGSYRPVFRPGPVAAAMEVERRPRRRLPPVAAGLNGRWNFLWSLVGILISAVGVAAYVFSSHREKESVFHSVPLTSFRGHEMNPALSPDGQSVAFTWNGEKQDNFDIHVMRLGSNALVRLTSDAADDVSPAWSPDGSSIAFIRRRGGERGELLLISANGGPEHKIREIVNRRLNDDSSTLISLSWSPDGHWIAASDRREQDSSERIYLFSPTGESRPLISTAGVRGDQMPAFSPDGNALAFSRLQGWSTSEIYEVPLNRSLEAGAPRRLTETGRWYVHPVWLSTGRILYLAARQPGAPHELRIAGPRLAAANVLRLDTDATEFAVGNGRLVYTHLKKDTNIWRAGIPASGEAPSSPAIFIASTWRDEKPRFSPDGRKIAFTSSRSGSDEIWVANADGSSPVRITSFGGPVVGYASWSPDGQWLVFHARPEGQGDLFVIPAAGGPLKNYRL